MTDETSKHKFSWPNDKFLFSVLRNDAHTKQKRKRSKRCSQGMNKDRKDIHEAIFSDFESLIIFSHLLCAADCSPR